MRPAAWVETLLRMAEMQECQRHTGDDCSRSKAIPAWLSPAASRAFLQHRSYSCVCRADPLEVCEGMTHSKIQCRFRCVWLVLEPNSAGRVGQPRLILVLRSDLKWTTLHTGVDGIQTATKGRFLSHYGTCCWSVWFEGKKSTKHSVLSTVLILTQTHSVRKLLLVFCVLLLCSCVIVQYYIAKSENAHTCTHP